MAFDVASVRPNTSGPGSPFVRRLPGGGLEVGNVLLRDLIMYAYGVQRFRLFGGPDWIASERFDISARAGGDVSATPIAGIAPETLMLRALLAERFKLAVHRETRELPIFELVLARGDGQLGPQLRRSAADCNAKAANAADGSRPPDAPGGRPQCGSRGGPGTMIAGGMPVSAFPDFLAGFVQRTVVDRTGLTGLWDVDLTFAPDVVPGAASQDTSRPSLFTALQEQLGLRLEPATGPVEVLVIDRVERPTAD
jgi:uncharacterized protein (TIGR03435 family)